MHQESEIVPPEKSRFQLRILETIEEMVAVEALQRLVWPGNETDIVPAHLLITAAHNGGLVIGAYDVGEGGKSEEGVEYSDTEEWRKRELPSSAVLVGFVFGFAGLDTSSGKVQMKHCSHMLGVHPAYRNQGIGFALKRAQWQMVRHQGLSRITWTYDPLLSRNAHLNITRLGAVCNTYLREVYGEMRDALNVGTPSDRFQVDWWVNSKRVLRRLSRQARLRLDLAHFLAAGAQIINPSHLNEQGLPVPGEVIFTPSPSHNGHSSEADKKETLILVEIPSEFLSIKAMDASLALAWRMHTREIFESLFAMGYLVTDFVYLPGDHPRSFYVLSFGESTL